MIEDRELQELVDFQGETPVLSLYLDTDLAHRSKDAVRLMARHETRELSKVAPDEVGEIERFLDFEYDWQSRGLAIFASGDELWKAIPLPTPAVTRAYYAEKPYVRVLKDMLDRFAEYAVALVDQQSVRLFDIAWGEIRAESAGAGEEIKRHRQGGRSAARYQRHEDNVAMHNLKQTVEMIQAFCQEHDCTRLMLAGSTESLALLKEQMPKPMLNQVVGEFAADIDASPREILMRSLDIVYQVDLAEEQRMVEEAITAAAKGRTGVVGLSDTLVALQRAQVRTLLVEENFHAPGGFCTNCGTLATEISEECAFCSQATMQEAADVVNQAIARALQTGAEVNIVRQNEALTQAGGIAAILRY